jgi:hypothetical protein
MISIWQAPFVSLWEIHFDGAHFRRDIAAKTWRRLARQKLGAAPA